MMALKMYRSFYVIFLLYEWGKWLRFFYFHLHSCHMLMFNWSKWSQLQDMNKLTNQCPHDKLSHSPMHRNDLDQYTRRPLKPYLHSCDLRISEMHFNQCLRMTRDIFCNMLGLLGLPFGLGKLEMFLKQHMKLWYQHQWMDRTWRYKYSLSISEDVEEPDLDHWQNYCWRRKT